MRILALEIAGLRNLIGQRITPGPRGNLFCGPNGAGKTSMLEAIYLLGTGRSFRTTSFESAIAYGEPLAVVSAVVGSDDGEHRVGIERRRDGGIHARIDGRDLSNASSLALQLPCHLLDASTIGVVVGGPKSRRQLLDWGVFHVEHEFAALTRQLRGVLAHRNALLSSADAAQLRFWDVRFADLALQVHEHRARYMERLVPEFQDVLGTLEAPPIEVSYRPGWSTDRHLADVLSSARESERGVGRTLYGPHRADLRLSTAGRLLPQALSRGQQKVVAYALVLAQIRLELKTTPRPAIVLVDDLLAELDMHHAALVNAALQDLGVQYFVTSIDCGSSAFPLRDEQFLVFHVERGMISLDAI